MAASPYRLLPRLAFCFLLRVLVLREKKAKGGNSKGSGCVSAFVWLLLSLIFCIIFLFYSIFFFSFSIYSFSLFLDRLNAP